MASESRPDPRLTERSENRENDVPDSLPGNKEPAEGSRETAGSGISNRPESEERDNQERLPPRGEAKEDDVVD